MNDKLRWHVILTPKTMGATVSRAMDKGELPIGRIEQVGGCSFMMVVEAATNVDALERGTHLLSQFLAAENAKATK